MTPAPMRQDDVEGSSNDSSEGRLARYVPRVDERRQDSGGDRVAPFRGASSRSGERPARGGGRGAGAFVVCPHCQRAFPDEEGRQVADRDIYFVLELRVECEDASFGAVTRAVKRSLALWALAECGGVKVAAARLLGLKYSTFWEMSKRLGVEDGDWAPGRDSDRLPDLSRVRSVRLVFEGTETPEEVSIDLADGDAVFDTVVYGFQRRLALRALEQTDGVLAHAAELLDVKYPTFYAMARRLGIAGEPGESTSSEDTTSSEDEPDGA